MKAVVEETIQTQLFSSTRNNYWSECDVAKGNGHAYDWAEHFLWTSTLKTLIGNQMQEIEMLNCIQIYSAAQYFSPWHEKMLWLLEASKG